MSQHSSRGREWERVRQVVLARDNHVCVECGAPATHIDHIIPKAAGGTDALDNLQAMCRTHNLKKGASLVVRTTYINQRWFKDITK